MSETKQAAWALRAAKSITSTKAWLADHTWDDEEAAEGFEQQLAGIIDHESARPQVEELVGAAVEALTFVKGMRNDAIEDHYFKLAESAGASASRLEEAIRALEAALGGKAE